MGKFQLVGVRILHEHECPQCGRSWSHTQAGCSRGPYRLICERCWHNQQQEVKANGISR